MVSPVPRITLCQVKKSLCRACSWFITWLRMLNSSLFSLDDELYLTQSVITYFYITYILWCIWWTNVTACSAEEKACLNCQVYKSLARELTPMLPLTLIEFRCNGNVFQLCFVCDSFHLWKSIEEIMLYAVKIIESFINNRTNSLIDRYIYNLSMVTNRTIPYSI